MSGRMDIHMVNIAGWGNREVINLLLFKELKGKDVVVRMDNDVLGSVALGPFNFNYERQVLDYVFEHNGLSGVIQFDPKKPVVIVNALRGSTGMMEQIMTPIGTMIPKDLGEIVVLELYEDRRFDIETAAMVESLYTNWHKLPDTWLRALDWEEHPLMETVGGKSLMGYLYNTDQEESLLLGQLGYLVNYMYDK